MLRRLVAVALLGLAACETPAFYAKRLAPLVGAPEDELVRRFGVPDATFDTDGRRFLQYEDVQVSHFPGTPGHWRRHRHRDRIWHEYVPGTPPTTVVRQCRTTWEVADARVRGFSFAGNGCVATDPDRDR